MLTLTITNENTAAELRAFAEMLARLADMRGTSIGTTATVVAAATAATPPAGEPARPRGRPRKEAAAATEPATTPEATEPAATPAPESVPPVQATPPVTKLTHDDARAALKAVVDRLGLPAATKVLGSFGVKSVSLLADGDLKSFIDACSSWEG